MAASWKAFLEVFHPNLICFCNARDGIFVRLHEGREPKTLNPNKEGVGIITNSIVGVLFFSIILTQTLV